MIYNKEHKTISDLYNLSNIVYVGSTGVSHPPHRYKSTNFCTMHYSKVNNMKLEEQKLIDHFLKHTNQCAFTEQKNRCLLNKAHTSTQSNTHGAVYVITIPDQTFELEERLQKVEKLYSCLSCFYAWC